MGLSPAAVDRWAFTTKEPIGIVAAISAFNHPLNLIVHQVAPAIAVGCPVIVKPAGTTPLSCLDFVALVHEAGLAGSLVPDLRARNHELAEKLATDPRVAFLSFIGSAKVGWYLHSKLAHGARSALEHGGVGAGDRRPQRRSRRDHRADREGRLLPCRPGLRVDAAHLSCMRTSRTTSPSGSRRAGEETAGPATPPSGHRGRPADPAEGGRPRRLLDRRGGEGRRQARDRRRKRSPRRRWSRPCCSIPRPRPASRSSRSSARCRDLPLWRTRRRDRAGELAAGRLPGQHLRGDIDVALRAANRLDASAVMINDPTTFRTDWMPFAGRRRRHPATAPAASPTPCAT
jgi:hypothetical protein